MTNLQDIVVNEMKVKKHIDSEQESREIFNLLKAMFNHIHLLNL